VDGNDDHAGVEGLYGIGELQVMVLVKLVSKPLAEFYFGGKDKVGVEKFEAYAQFITEINGADFKEFIGPAGICVGGHIVVELAAGQAVKTEILYAVAFKFQLKRELHVYILNVLGNYAVGRDAVFINYILFGKCQAGHKPEVNEMRKPQVTDQAQVKTRLPVRLYALKGIGSGE